MRKLLKTPGATFAYNVTDHGMVEQINDVYRGLFDGNTAAPRGGALFGQEDQARVRGAAAGAGWGDEIYLRSCRPLHRPGSFYGMDEPDRPSDR